MSQLPTPSTKPHTGTWRGRPGTQTVWQTAQKQTSLHVVWQQWTDGSGEGHAILAEGDGRVRPGLRGAQIVHVRIDNPTADQVAELIGRLPQVWHKPSRGRRAA